MAFDKQQYKKEYDIKHREYNRQYNKNKIALDPSKHYKKVRDRRTKVRFDLVELLGGQCQDCSYDTFLALQIDHIYSDAKQDKARFKNDIYVMYYYYLTHPDEAKERVQVLCANCNRLKVYSHNETKRKYK